MTLIELKEGAALLGWSYECMRLHRAKGELRGLFYQASKHSRPKMVFERIEEFKKKRIVD